MIIDLRNLRDLDPGTIVISSKGFEFEFLGHDERNKEIWLDRTGELKWFDDEEGEFNHYQAMEKFNSPEKRLPTKEEFEGAESRGFREVIPKIEGYRWSASVHPNNSYYAYDFNGGYGYVDSVYRNSYYVSVRCVGR